MQLNVHETYVTSDAVLTKLFVRLAVLRQSVILTVYCICYGELFVSPNGSSKRSMASALKNLVNIQL